MHVHDQLMLPLKLLEALKKILEGRAYDGMHTINYLLSAHAQHAISNLICNESMG